MRLNTEMMRLPGVQKTPMPIGRWDRRLDGFLRRQLLVRLVEDGDTCYLILDRVMAYIAARARLSV